MRASGPRRRRPLLTAGDQRAGLVVERERDRGARLDRHRRVAADVELAVADLHDVVDRFAEEGSVADGAVPAVDGRAVRGPRIDPDVLGSRRDDDLRPAVEAGLRAGFEATVWRLDHVAAVA